MLGERHQVLPVWNRNDLRRFVIEKLPVTFLSLHRSISFVLDDGDLQPCERHRFRGMMDPRQQADRGVRGRSPDETSGAAEQDRIPDVSDDV